jgi:hypothetical protein
MRKWNKGQIGITRPSGGEYDGQYMSIRVECSSSRLDFLEIKISLENLMKALSGQYGIEMDFYTRGLEHVGKTKISKPLVFEMPEGSSYATDYKELAKELAIANADDGYTPSLYFDSRSSFYTNEHGKQMAQTHQFKYAEKEDDDSTVLQSNEKD